MAKIEKQNCLTFLILLLNRLKTFIICGLYSNQTGVDNDF